LYNCSGADLLVDFSITLSVPSHGQIDASAVKNVLISALPRIEMNLNGIRIDRSSVSVQYYDSHS
uniref:SEA domain-containing protein n=1 Tax=Gongylonema pulchrum TaxID=637853 RepID=A0A183EIQ4_9BILA